MDHVKPASITDTVKEYHGRVLKTSADLKTSACCLTETLPPHVLAALKDVHNEVKDRFYGCGSPIPPALEGITVLDLGCGSGRDCYVLSRLVGPQGPGHRPGHDRRAAGRGAPPRPVARGQVRSQDAQLRVRQGYIEDLQAAGIADNSVDLVISNCVLNLSPDKPRVFREIFRVLKPGGELYFSDVFADRRIPKTLAADSVLLGEGLGGALYIEDFRCWPKPAASTPAWSPPARWFSTTRRSSARPTSSSSIP